MTHIVVLHRWRDKQALYENYLDHSACRVTYVATDLALGSVPSTAAAVRTVPATDDFDAVWDAVAELSARFGLPYRVVALNEGDLDTAALLREKLGCTGQQPAQLDRFRDKLVMNQTVSAAGVATPPFADAPDKAAILDFADTHGWPLVAKPRKGTASRGVRRLDSPDDVAELCARTDEPYLVQKFCPDTIYHVDGLWTGEGLGPWRASRYINTCVDFTEGEALGSVEEDSLELLSPIGEFAAAAASALSREPWVFHLEVFVGTSPDGTVSLNFLEAGCRVGGAEIPFVWREVHGIDLMSAAADIQLGRTPQLPFPENWFTAGWLLVPPPVGAPCRVVSWALPESPAPGTGPYASVIPPVGDVVPRIGGYEHVGARFRFQGKSSDEVAESVRRTAAEFRLDCAPATPATPYQPRTVCGLDR